MPINRAPSEADLTAVIFDGDDTLWETEELYDQCRSEAARIVQDLELDGDHFEKLQRELDVKNVARFGLSPERFPTSSVQAYELLASAAGKPVKQEVADRIFAVSSRVFQQRAPLYSNVEEVLEEVRVSHKLGLLTKGDHNVQTKRIDDSGLRSYFDAIRIVDEKDKTAFMAMLNELRTQPGKAWSVGNSLRSDILPALEIGMRAIWIETHVWEHERAHGYESLSDPRLFFGERLKDIPTMLSEFNSLSPP